MKRRWIIQAGGRPALGASLRCSCRIRHRSPEDAAPAPRRANRPVELDLHFEAHCRGEAERVGGHKRDLNPSLARWLGLHHQVRAHDAHRRQRLVRRRCFPAQAVGRISRRDQRIQSYTQRIAASERLQRGAASAWRGRWNRINGEPDVTSKPRKQGSPRHCVVGSGAASGRSASAASATDSTANEVPVVSPAHLPLAGELCSRPWLGFQMALSQ